jgi:hypothetical protein
LSEIHEDFVKRKRGFDSEITGYIGECLVQLEIAKRFRMRVHKIPDELNFDSDFITATGIKLQVKTRRVTKHTDKRPGRTPVTYLWEFQDRKSVSKYVARLGSVGARVRRQRARFADFYIFVCLPRTGYEPRGFFVIPSEALITQDKDNPEKLLTSFAINQADFGNRGGKTSRWVRYRDNWDPLVGDNKDRKTVSGET